MKHFLLACLFLTSTLSAISSESLLEQYPNHVPTGERALSQEEYFTLQKERIQLEEEGGEDEEIDNEKELAPKRLIKSKKALFGSTKIAPTLHGFTVYGKYHSYYSSHEGAFHSPLSVSVNGDAVEIEDGSIWTVKYGDKYKTLNWLNGDILVIVPNGEWFSGYRYKLINVNTGVTVRTNLTLKPLYNGVYTHWITGIDYTNRLVYLDDGSCWKLPWYEQGVLSHWLLDDTVIIGTNDGLFTSDSLPNILINTATEDYVLGTCLN